MAFALKGQDALTQGVAQRSGHATKPIALERA